MKCPTCHTESVVLTPNMVDLQIRKMYTPDQMLRLETGHVLHLVDGSITKVSEQGPPLYDECEQGAENPVWYVVETDGRFFKKLGYSDSYGNITWTEGMNEVQPKTRTVTFYE